MDEVYLGYRITVKCVDASWVARITHVRGTVVHLDASSSIDEGEAICLARAKAGVERLVKYLKPTKPEV